MKSNKCVVRKGRAWMPVLILHLLSLCVFLLQITSGEYVEQFLESVEVCTSAAVGPFSDLAKKRIRLQNYPNNTVMVKLTRWEEFWPSFLNFRCKFQVTAPKKFGVMVVIQSMHLRTKKIKGTGCRDFIKFEQNDGFKTGQICGELDEEDFTKTPERIVGQRFFYDNKGAIDVSFSTDDKDEIKDDDVGKKPVFLKMIFTAYQECSDMAISQGKVRRCSSLRSQSCISSNLFCDGEINCGFNDSDFGSDEGTGCDGGRSSSGGGDKFSLIPRQTSFFVFGLTCIATLILVVVLAFLACCCVKRYGIRRNPERHLSNLEFEDPLEFHMAAASHNLSTLSSHDESGRSEKRPEDRPPAYDDLFPIPDTKTNKDLKNKGKV